MAETALTAAIQDAYIQGISARSVDDLVHPMGKAGASSPPSPPPPSPKKTPGAPGPSGVWWQTNARPSSPT